jgi:hypothetical protein
MMVFEKRSRNCVKFELVMLYIAGGAFYTGRPLEQALPFRSILTTDAG